MVREDTLPIFTAQSMKIMMVYKTLFSTREHKERAISLKRLEHRLRFVHTSRFTGKLSIYIMTFESKHLTTNIFKNTTFLQIRAELK